MHRNGRTCNLGLQKGRGGPLQGRHEHLQVDQVGQCEQDLAVHRLRFLLHRQHEVALRLQQDHPVQPTLHGREGFRQGQFPLQPAREFGDKHCTHALEEANCNCGRADTHTFHGRWRDSEYFLTIRCITLG
jgi:hypothetical protein